MSFEDPFFWEVIAMLFLTFHLLRWIFCSERERQPRFNFEFIPDVDFDRRRFERQLRTKLSRKFWQAFHKRISFYRQMRAEMKQQLQNRVFQVITARRKEIRHFLKNQLKTRFCDTVDVRLEKEIETLSNLHVILDWDQPVLDIIAAFLLPHAIALLEFNERRIKYAKWEVIFFRHNAVCSCGASINDHINRDSVISHKEEIEAVKLEELNDFDREAIMDAKETLNGMEKLFLQTRAEIPDGLEKRWMKAFGRETEIIPDSLSSISIETSGSECETFMKNALKLERLDFGSSELVFECRNETFTGMLIRVDEAYKSGRERKGGCVIL